MRTPSPLVSHAPEHEARAPPPNRVKKPSPVDPSVDSSSPPMDSDHGGGSAGHGGGGARNGIGGGGGLGRGLSGRGGSGGENSFAIGGGCASAAAWIRLVSSGVEDELVGTGGGGGGAGAGGLPYGHFLEACCLCRKPLASNRDIFMYRGDIPFCSEECRREQIEMDEEMERKEKKTSKKVAPMAPPPRDVESPPRPPKARAGSILAG